MINKADLNKEKIYFDHLKIINDVSFTLREVDIIACIINNRGEKKIAYFLAISPKTVSAHVRTIMQKLACNSKEAIIDFVEKSGKKRFFQRYYSCLLIVSVFKDCLIKIGQLYNRKGLSINVFTEINRQAQAATILPELQKDLKLANITLNITNIVDNEEILLLKLLLENTNKSISIIIDKKPFNQTKFIDFSANNNYYFSVLELLMSVVDNVKLEVIVDEFKKYYKNIDAFDEVICNNKVVKQKTFLRWQKLPALKSLNISNPFYIFLFFILICLIIIVLIYFFLIEPYQKHIAINSNQNSSVLLNDLISAGFSTDNVTKKQVSINYDLIKQVENIVQLSKTKKHFDIHSASITLKELIPYVYILHSLSQYYLANEHNGAKAKTILEYAKNLIEDYVNSRNIRSINFSGLGYKEIYIELSIFEDLPEMYTKILYSLGRASLLLEEWTEALNYFFIARDLGNKLKLFEGYLSIRSGIGIIEGNFAIQKGQYDKLGQIIDVYKNLKIDYNLYKVDYRPKNAQPKTIIPKEDAFNNIVCADKIIYYYGILLAGKQGNEQKYLQEISEQLLGYNKIGLIDLTNATSEKQSAKIYNTLGNLFLRLYDQNIKFKDIKLGVIKKLHLTISNDLGFIKQIFELAKSKSRSTEYPRADSYSGLIKVYERELKYTSDPEAINDIIAKINKYRKARDKINKLLNRKKNIMD